jgi:hypothetical protein
MKSLLNSICGFGAGVGLTYFFDPDLGKRRRALVRDQLVSGCCKATNAVDVMRRDAVNRLYGTGAEVASLFTGADASDEVITQRIRSKLGRWVSHPAAIDVRAHDGRIRLAGPILADEVEDCVAHVRSIRGVRHVDNDLEVYSEPGNLSALQGGSEWPGEAVELMQQKWSPAMQGAFGLTGLTLSAIALTKGGRTGGFLSGAIAATIIARLASASRARRESIRQRLGSPANAIHFGINWANKRTTPQNCRKRGRRRIVEMAPRDDLEQLRQIERNIAQLLFHGEPAIVEKATIERGYGILNAGEGKVPSTVHEKCAAIVGVLKDQYSIDAEYSILNGTVRFCPFAACGHQHNTSESNASLESSR